MTRGAVHWHFKNKEGLLFAIGAQAQERFSREVADLSHLGYRAHLDAVADAAIAIFARLEDDRRHKGLLRMVLRSDILARDRGDGVESAYRKNLHDALLSAFEAVEKNGALRSGWTAAAAAQMTAAFICGLIAEWALDESLEFAPAADIVREMLGSLLAQD
ncbi:hypothetical protein [Falsirhodobacter sp. 1013]|uniref:hypothetical protein n=1 Tax=Falsirhodobacter sp. 1013 TaxID=3417566 RepID=UPI003EBE2395